MKSKLSRSVAGLVAILGLVGSTTATAGPTSTTLADSPVFAGANVPGNLALSLSVEYPTAISVANLGDYADATQYLGYFDPQKCYVYNYVSPGPASYFQPQSFAIGASGHQCAGLWSGNFMNWAAMQTIDPFRWALTGGYRSVDTNSQTIIEKAWGSQQGSAPQNFPYRGTLQPTGGNNLPGPGSATNLIPLVTPFGNWANFDSGIWGNGNMMVFTAGNGYTTAATASGVSDLTSVPTANTSTGSQATYRVYVRVQVCVPGLLEANCVQYPAAPAAATVYKPQGLMQTYANKIRYSAFSYLNDTTYSAANGFTSTYGVRQGGVLREPMGFIGPTYPQPNSASVITNTLDPEWSAATGIMSSNPDTATASGSGVSQSGVMNYLNKFGEYGQSYMTYDNVSELYYASIRYFEKLGNVPEWTNSVSSTELDGFPAVTAWKDPIAYSCQKNFILGIGDDHTWIDGNVGGGNYSAGLPVPPAVSADTLNQAGAWTTDLQTLEGITPTPSWSPPGDSGSTYYIAGLAYGAHVLDIRPDLDPNPQTSPPTIHTVSTFWMDVAEDQEVENLNPYYLATKYGGFNVPSTTPPYSISNTIPLPVSEWDTTGQSIVMNGGNTHPLPDNYFRAGNAAAMVSGLTSAFTNISNAVSASSTAFSFSAASVQASNTLSFASSYSSVGWTSVITASTLTFDANGNPTAVIPPVWTSSTTLQSQLTTNNGWSTARHVVTWNGSSAVAFEPGNLGSLSTAQQNALNVGALVPTYSSATTAAQYMNYLRGDQSNEVGSSVTPSTKSLRARTILLGDIVDAALVPVATPAQNFSETYNPGYAAFANLWAARPTMVYAAANDGMMHGFVGTSGVEQFAYMPGEVIAGPNGTPQVDGLAQLGNPNYNHHFYVDATPIAFDIDFNHTSGNMTGTPNWHTLLIGGLGKGGRSFYAIDVTNPAAMNSEAAVASQVKWEFTNNTTGTGGTIGYSFGAPIVIKTAQYGWVVAFTSGYDNSDGVGYLYLVNPVNGALLQKIATPMPSNGMTQASAYVKDYSDYTADSIYVGDLNGQLWRFDLTATSGAYPAPTLLAVLTDANGNAQPVTTAPLIEISPTTRKRYVMLGTGQLLSSLDIVWPNTASPSLQSFYVIGDGTAGVFNTVATPITRANLTAVAPTALIAGGILPATSKGYYIDLGQVATSPMIGYRVVINPKAYDGMVSFATLLTSGDACSPQGTGQVYSFNYATAKSVLQSNTLPYVAFNSAVVNLKYVGGVNTNGTTDLIAGLASGAIYKVPITPVATIATRILNWRELPTVE